MDSPERMLRALAAATEASVPFPSDAPVARAEQLGEATEVTANGYAVGATLRHQIPRVVELDHVVTRDEDDSSRAVRSPCSCSNPATGEGAKAAVGIVATGQAVGGSHAGARSTCSIEHVDHANVVARHVDALRDEPVDLKVERADGDGVVVHADEQGVVHASPQPCIASADAAPAAWQRYAHLHAPDARRAKVRPPLD